MSTNSNKPVKEYRSGGVKASIWRNDVQQDGRTSTQYSVRIQKTYRDKSGNWKTSEYYYPEDLSRLALVANKAFEFISLKESQDAPDDGNIPL